MLLSEVLTLVRSSLDETTAGFWSNTELIAWVNAGVRDIARRTEIFIKNANVAVSANTQDYVTPFDMLRINRIEFEPNGSDTIYHLEYRDANNMEDVWQNAQKTAKGTPTYFTIWGSFPYNWIKLWPTPSAAGVLHVYYYASPAAVTTLSDAVSIPAGWEDALIDYCEYKALRKARDTRWSEAKQEYEEKVAELFDKTRRLTDQSGGPVVGYGGGSSVPSWLSEF